MRFILSLLYQLIFFVRRAHIYREILERKILGNDIFI